MTESYPILYSFDHFYDSGGRKQEFLEETQCEEPIRKMIHLRNYLAYKVGAWTDFTDLTLVRFQVKLGLVSMTFISAN